MGQRAAWVLVGLALDAAAVAALLAWPAGATLFSEGNALDAAVAALALLAVVHGLVLPGLVWPGRALRGLDVARTLLLAALAAPGLMLAGQVALAATAAVLFSIPFGKHGQAPLLAVVGLAAAATGALCFGAVGLVARLCGSGRVRTGPGAWAGAAAAVALGASACFEGASYPLLLGGWVVLLLSGLPHLVLTARRLPPGLAPLPVALRRAGVVSAVLLAAGLLRLR